jgi:hypothetical protein
LYRRYEAGLHGYTYLTRDKKNGDTPQMFQPTLVFQKTDA